MPMRRAHDDRRGDVGQHVQHGQAPGRSAQRRRALDEDFLLERARLGVDHAGEPRPVGDRQREDDVGQRWAERLGDGDGQHHLGHRQEDVGHAHQQIAEPAVVVAGQQTDRHADQQRGADRDHADQDRDAGAEQQAAVDVGAHPVGAEPVGRAGRPQPLGRVQLEHVVGMRGQHRRQQRRGDQRGDQQEAEQRGAIARQPRQHEGDRLHVVRSRGSTSVWATSTSRLTTMKTAPAQIVKPITAL